MTAPGIAVRVVDHGERRWLGWVVTVAAGLGTGAILLHMWQPHELLGISKYWSFGIACALWSLGTLLQWRRRPWVTRASAGGTALRLGRRTIPLSRITGVKVARGRHGFSIAIGGGWHAGQFLELESESETRRLVEQLGKRWPGTDVCTFAMRGDLLRALEQLAGAIGIVSALSYAVAIGGLDAPDLKALFGLPAIIAASLSSILFVAQPLLMSLVRVGDDVVAGRGAVTEHLRIHRTSGVRADSPPEPVAASGARGRILDRREETTRAWLERVDGLGESAGAYRSDAPTAEELRQIAENEAAPAQARLGALRLLARRHGGVPEELRARVAHDLGPRVRVVIEMDANLDEAAAELDALGPAFRARVG